jgi:hypothetical protein
MKETTMTASIQPRTNRRETSLLLLGGAVFAAGFILGSVSASHPAGAQQVHHGPAAAQTGFGFAVPAQGFALVKGEDGGAYVIDGRAEATRVLIAINPSAPDQPRQGSTSHLALD